MTESTEARFTPAQTGAVWGPEAERVLSGVQRKLRAASSRPDEDYARVRDDAYRVFSRCTNTQARDSQLVVGRVQAGKTTNFTAVAGLARENVYQFFVVLAGTKSELLSQTSGRLEQTLGSVGAASFPAFSVMELKAGDTDRLSSRVVTQLSTLRRSAIRGGTAPVLVVLKERRNLESLIGLLKQVQEQLPLEAIPTLLIDDEADQASPDNRTRRPGDATSTIHGLLGTIRQLLPWHTFLAYTATPQANLLMQLNGLLHPRTVTVIDAGADYVGVSDLFGSKSADYAREIMDTPPRPRRPPDSLREALATFLCQLVLVRLYRQQVIPEPAHDSEPPPMTATMLVNPGSNRTDHETWATLIDLELDAWQEMLEDPDDLAATRVLSSWVIPAWESLVSTLKARGLGIGVPARPTAEDLDHLQQLIPHLERRVINSSRTGQPLPRDDEWDRKPGWVLVGGEILGRGQTLRNLTTTYMPRTPGMRAIDTIQQRGRFYGYHGRYRALLRGWFEPDTLQVYKDAAYSEATLLHNLTQLDRSDQPLSSWTRTLLLGKGRLRATRNAVIPLVARDFKHHEWAFSQAYLLDTSVNDNNLGVLGLLLSKYGDLLDVFPGDIRPGTRNYTTLVGPDEAIGLLDAWSAAPAESQQLADVTLLLTALHDQDDLSQIRLVAMDRPIKEPSSTLSGGYRSRAGGNLTSDRIGNPLSQQQRPVVDSDLVTLQLHVFRVGDTPREQPTTMHRVQRAPALVVHLPPALRQRVVTMAADA